MRLLPWQSLLLPMFVVACSSGGLVSPGDGDAGGDATPTILACDHPTVTPPITVACVGALAKGFDSTKPVVATFEGRILELRQGADADGCVADYLPQLKEKGQLANARAYHVTLADGSEVVLGLISPLLPLFVGSSISFDVRYQFGGWGPSENEVTVRAGSRLVAYFGSAGTLDALKQLPAGLTLVPGRSVCASKGDCGEWAGYELDASGFGGRESIRPGAWAYVGSYIVHNEGLVHETPSEGRCADWFVSSASVLILPHYLED